MKSYLLLVFLIFLPNLSATNAYVTDFIPDAVTIIDTTNNAEIGVIPVNPTPTALDRTADGQFIYVTCAGSSPSVNVIRVSDRTVVHRITDTSLSSPTDIAMTPDSKHAWVVNSSGIVSIISTETNTVIDTIPVSTSSFRIAISSNGLKAYVTNPDSNSVSVIDTTTRAVTTITTGIGLNPTGIGVTPDNQFIYVMNAKSSTISVIRAATNTVPYLIKLPDLSAPGVIAFTPDGRFAYVPDLNPPYHLFVIDTETSSIVDTIIHPTFNGPSDIAMTPDGRFAYVTNKSDTTVSVVQTTIPREVIQTIRPSIKMETPIAEEKVLPLEPPTEEFNKAVIQEEIPFVEETLLQLEPPINFTIKEEINDFGLIYEYVIHLNWRQNPTSLPSSGYYIYRDGKRVATVSNDQFHYQISMKKKGKRHFYSVTAFGAAGRESASVILEVK